MRKTLLFIFVLFVAVFAVACTKEDKTVYELADQTVTYDGQAHSLVLTADGVELTEGVTYTNNDKVNAGVYTVTAVYKNATYNGTLTINKANYDVTGLKFESGSYDYDGEAHSLQATGLPQGVTVSYVNNSLTNAGTQEVTAKFTVDGNHNAIADKKATLTVNKVDYDLTGLKFEGKSVTYTGEAQSLEATGLPQGVTVQYVNNTLTNVGSVEVTAKFTVDGNHNAIADKKATLTITKATVDASALKFENKTVTYNGQEQEITVAGLPTGVTVVYTNNKLTNVGSTEATAKFTVSDNYNAIADMKATLTITALEVAVDWNKADSYTYTGEALTAPSANNEGYVITVAEKDSKEFKNAGSYQFVASTTNTNITLTNTTLDVTVGKATYDMSGVTFASKNFFYDGKEHEITYSGDLPTGVTVKELTNNKLTALGSTEATLSFTVADTDNYNEVTDMKATIKVINGEFGDEADLAYYTYSSYYSEYVEEYEGHTGLVYFENTGDQPNYNHLKFNFNVDASSLADWDVIEIVYKAESTEAKLQLYTTTWLSWYKTNEWVTLVIPKDKLGDVDKILNGKEDLCQLINNPITAFYIDKVEFRKYKATTAENMAQGFESEKDIKTYALNKDAEWVEEYKGAYGVAKQTYSQEDWGVWSGFTFKVNGTYDLSQVNAINVRVYIESSGTGTGETFYNDNYGMKIPFNTWSTITLDPSKIHSNALSGGNYLFTFINCTVTAVYVDYIDVELIQTSTDGTTHTQGFDTNVGIKNYAKNKDAKWVSEFEGAKGVVRQTYTLEDWGVWSGFTFKVADTIDMSKVMSISVRVYIKSSGTGTGETFYNDNYGMKIPVNTWSTITLDPTKVHQNALTGGYYLFTFINCTVEYVYVDYIDIELEQTSTDGSTHACGFDSNKGYTTYAKNTDAVWLSEYEGAKGVVRQSYGTSVWNGFNFDLTKMIGELSASDILTVTIKMYIQGTSATGKAQAYYNDNYGVWYKMNEWVEFTVQASYLGSTDFTGEHYVVTFINTTKLEYVYVDYIDIVTKYDTSADTTTHSLGFDNATDGNAIAGNNKLWIAEFEGAKGVMRQSYESGDVWNGIRIPVITDETVTVSDVNNNIKEFVVKAYIKATGTEANNGKVRLYCTSDIGWVETNKWVTFSVPGAQINDMQRVDGTWRFFTFFDCETFEYVYVDYVDVIEYGASTDGTIHTAGFDKEAELASVAKNTDAEWLTEYEGAKGVAKQTHGNDAWNGYTFALPGTINMDNVKAVKIKLYAVGTGTTTGNETKAQVYDKVWDLWIDLNQWTTLTIKAANIRDNSLAGSDYMFALMNATVTAVYVDYIDVEYYQSSSDGTTHTVSFNDEKGFNTYATNNGAEWLAEYEGAKGVVKEVREGDTWSGYKVNAIGTNNVADVKEVKVRMYIVGTGTQSGKESQAQVYHSGYGTWVNLNEWVVLTLPGTVLTGECKLDGTSRLFTFINCTDTAVYIDYVDVTYYQTSTDGSNHDFGFDTDKGFTNVAKTTGAEWLVDFEGRLGVVKQNYGSSCWNGFFFNLANGAAVSTLDFDYISIMAYIGSETKATEETYLPGGIYREHYQTNKWVEMRLSKSDLGTLATLDGSAYMFTFITGDVSFIAVDYIDLVKLTDSVEVFRFDNEGDLKFVKNDNASILDTFDGKSGVLKLANPDHTGYYGPMIRFARAAADYASLANATHIRFVMYLDSTGTRNDGKAECYLYPTDSTSVYGPAVAVQQWITVDIAINKVANDGCMFGTSKLFGIFNGVLDNLYIDSISFVSLS